MLSDQSFFKKIPTVITLEQRLIWEGAGWAIDMIFGSYERLRQAAIRIDTGSTQYPTLVAQEMFACAWSIIDQCHMLCNILKRSSPPPRGPTANFIERCKAVTLIRNSMDHLHSNIKNIANKKSALPPLFGAMSFSRVEPEHVIEGKLRGCKVITITAGALTHPNHTFGFLNPAGRSIELPVGMFEFEAFEHRLSLSDLVLDLRKLVEIYDTDVKAEQEEQIRRFARDNGLDEEKVMNEHLGSLMIGLEIRFDNDDSGV
jgi:hypothetical protein